MYSESIIPELDGWEGRLELVLQNVEENRTIGKPLMKGGGNRKQPFNKGRSVAQIEADFWYRVKTGSKGECWPWLGGCSNYKQLSGKVFSYGVFWSDRTKHKSHRFASEFRYGLLPCRIQACHHCDNPICCNPHHLFIGTQRENTIDMVKKGRNRYGIGINHNSVKLTLEQVLRIKREFPDRKDGWAANLGREFGVRRGTITAIGFGKSWKHLS